MKVAISTQDISMLVKSCTWSGDTSQAARKLEVEFVADDRDPLLPIVDIDNGMTCYGGDDEGNVVFVGNIYSYERDRKNSTVKFTALDNLFVLNRSKTSRKYTDALPESITKEVCGEMGILTGSIVETGEYVSFIANAKTGFQIIKQAYDEASKKNGKKYQCFMNRNKLDVIEQGTLIEFELDSAKNMTESIYKESIQELVNRVMIVDEAGNPTGEFISDDESIGKYSMFQALYRTNREKDTTTEAKSLLTAPKREGIVTALGNYTAVSGYSITVRDSLFQGKFFIRSDCHSFKPGYYEMKLTLEFTELI